MCHLFYPAFKNVMLNTVPLWYTESCICGICSTKITKKYYTFDTVQKDMLSVASSVLSNKLNGLTEQIADCSIHGAY